MAQPKRPRTGDKRERNQPLKIDKLPPYVHDALLQLRNGAGKTWMEIEDLSALSKNDGGFIDWENLPTIVLELFPDMRLPHSSLHRWYDLRVAQVRKDVEQRSAIAREVAESFAASVVEGSDEAVLNAARDQLMSLLAEDLTPSGRAKTVKSLISLAETLQSARLNQLRERKVGIDERKIKILEQREATARARLDREAEAAKKKLVKGELTPDDINRLRERVFGIPPAQAVLHGS